MYQVESSRFAGHYISLLRWENSGYFSWSIEIYEAALAAAAPDLFAAVKAVKFLTTTRRKQALSIASADFDTREKL